MAKLNPATKQAVSPEAKADELLAKMALVQAKKVEVEKERKELEAQLVALAQDNRVTWFGTSKTKNFENGKISISEKTVFEIEKEKEGKAVEVMTEEFPECLKVSFEQGKIKGLWVNDTMRTRLEALGLTQKTEEILKVDCKKLPTV